MNKQEKKLTIGIDARFWNAKARGLSRYVQNLIYGLESIDFHNNYIVFLLKKDYPSYKPNNKNFRKKIFNCSWYSFQEQIVGAWVLDDKKVDLMHFPHFNVPILYNKPFIVTIHDLILLKFANKENTTLGSLAFFVKKFGYLLVLRSALKKANAIIAVSNFTKRAIIKHKPEIKAKIRTVYQACPKLHKRKEEKQTKSTKSLALTRIKQQKIKALMKKRRYLLYVGAAYPHKNLERLLLAFNKIRKDERYKNLNLFLVGGRDHFYQKLKSFKKFCKMKQVVFLGFIKKNDILEELYVRAELLVSPSLYEGFGFPVFEAIKRGTAVACSKTGAIEELLGDSAIYFDPYNVDDICDKTKLLLTNKELQKKLVRQGKKKMKRLSWEKTARDTIKLYQEIGLKKIE
ncbi:MAG: glycosyltransferase [Candidatus Moranbacteria bacterium]|nr:glycosyltransferase [Candidatus Moranbacteria bacterium]